MNSLFFKGSFVFGCKNINIILKYNAMFIIFLILVFIPAR